MENTFDQKYLDLLATSVGSGASVKRSRYYQHAVVIGRKELPGAILLSQEREEVISGTSRWIINFFPCHHPKEVADGEIPLASSWGERFDTFFELLKYVEEKVVLGFN